MTIIDAMYRNFCTERFPLPTEEQVLAVERRIARQLPEDYREFLLAYNGGWFSVPRITPVVEGCPADGLDFLSGIGASDDCAELASEHDLALFDDNYPVEVLPIGYTVMGGLILLITHPEDNGNIVLKVAFGGSHFLAENIEEFFSLLRESEGS